LRNPSVLGSQFSVLSSGLRRAGAVPFAIA
jgi:hypothetical protein